VKQSIYLTFQWRLHQHKIVHSQEFWWIKLRGELCSNNFATRWKWLVVSQV